MKLTKHAKKRYPKQVSWQVLWLQVSLKKKKSNLDRMWLSTTLQMQDDPIQIQALSNVQKELDWSEHWVLQQQVKYQIVFMKYTVIT